ncbi:hypothetical protein F5X99DRAFT_415628 [Biscogniauxia marginata]|nr:hypothetical protein F5X99DRAFT_415628 [Biscogniauxia marginata]
MSVAIGSVNTATVPLCHIVTPVGMLGYGLDEDRTAATLASLVPTRVPTAIILDSGSTDSGPEKLALGNMTSPRTSYAKDLSKLLKLVHMFKVPLIFSSAGGDGSDEHVREIVQVIEEISDEMGNKEYSFKTVAIFSGIEKQIVVNRLRAGAVTGCGDCVPDLTEDDIEASARIVAQMGPEPFIDVMKANPDFDIIVGGRAYDPAPYVGYASYMAKLQLDNRSLPEVQRQFGGFTHMGKIMECGGICALPKSHGAIATVHQNGSFEITPMDPNARCTPLSVAAHTLYEKSRPDILYGPGGYLDLNTATYEQLEDERSVRVSGSVFHFSQERGLPYQVKLEAAKVVGYRTIFMGSFRDQAAAILIGQIDVLLEQVKAYAAQQHRGVPGNWELDFHYYGKPSEPSQAAFSKNTPEIFLIGEVLASTQQLATSVASAAKVAVTHGSYPGQKATSGNFAFGIGGKVTIPMGPCPQFCIYHLMDLEDGEEHLDTSHNDANVNGARGERKLLFSQSVSIIGRGQKSSQSNDAVSNPVSSKVAKYIGNQETKNRAEVGQSHRRFVSPGTLGELARVVRSKNAGPYEITFDVMFSSQDTFLAVKESGFFCPETVATLFDLPESDIIWCGFFDPAMAFKVTIPRIRAGKRVASGSFMENDVHGAQQYLPLMHLKLPEDLVAKLL